MQWPPLKRVGFRLLFVYLVLYCVQYPPADWLWTRLVPWVGQRLGLEATLRFTGSGDTTYQYVQVLCFALISVVAAVVWSLADHRRPHYHRLYLGLRILVRFSLGMAMIGYGAAKVIPSQFPPLSLYRLVQPFGEASPMGLLWTFMGASASYTIFGGVAEMLGGILLFFRHTTTLGGLVCAGVLSHVVALNFSYDVPVKLYSLHLLSMAIFVMAADARRLVNFFLFDRAVEAPPTETLMQRPAWRRAAFGLKMVLLVSATAMALHSSYSTRQVMVGHSPVHGIWDVEEFVQDGDVHPPLLSDQKRWRRLIVFGKEHASLERMDGERTSGYLFVRGEELFFNQQEFKFDRPTPDSLVLDGYFEHHDVRVRLHRIDEDGFLLNHRGFHWISEFPFNR